MKISKTSKILAVIMALVLALGLATCSANKDGEEGRRFRNCLINGNGTRQRLMRQQSFIISLCKRKTIS